MSSRLSLDKFATLCETPSEAEHYPQATHLYQGIPIYDGPSLVDALSLDKSERAISAEWGHCLQHGPGVFAISKAYQAIDVIDEMTEVFRQIILHEKATGLSKGDHFGNNERIWNSIQKTAVKAPHLFAEYYGNPFMALACRVWLGPSYQLTAQVNVVKPGSPAQSPHRDYHLGFQSDKTTASFPVHAQIMSQYLTLQGAIAHNDMPVESGPTQLLPNSHRYDLGYQAFRQPDFVEYFQNHFVQIPLKKGDLLFFSPALFHAAGSNQADFDRIANLVQISSAFGRPMETLNRYEMIKAVYPCLRSEANQHPIPERFLTDTIAALADGYAFPTNLDSDPPIDGNAPQTQQSLVTTSLRENRPWEELDALLRSQMERRQS